MKTVKKLITDSIIGINSIILFVDSECRDELRTTLAHLKEANNILDLDEVKLEKKQLIADLER